MFIQQNKQPLLSIFNFYLILYNQKVFKYPINIKINEIFYFFILNLKSLCVFYTYSPYQFGLATFLQYWTVIALYRLHFAGDSKNQDLKLTEQKIYQVGSS